VVSGDLAVDFSVLNRDRVRLSSVSKTPDLCLSTGLECIVILTNERSTRQWL